VTSVVPTHSSGSRFVDPTVLARIGNLELLARVVVEGFIQGLHRAPKLGASTDFAEHRAYQPGDDIRRIDWRLFGRTDRHFVKEYEADTNTNFTVVLDVSPSMHYGATADGTRISKLEYGCFIAACLCYFSSLQRDRIGLVTVDGDIGEYIPNSTKHLQLILHTLDRLLQVDDERMAHGESAQRPTPDARATQPAGRSELLPPMRKLAELFRRRSMVVVISDLYEEPDAIVGAVNHLRGRGNDIMVMHLLDPTELQFPFADATNFIDLETGEKMPVIPQYLRDQYQQVVREHVAALDAALGGQGMHYALFDTSLPLDEALFSYLSARERLARVR
jgi:uncharacterized protein (DUF58 family)